MPSNARGVECIGVSKTYATATGAIKALSSIDATFAPAAVTAVMGPSGSGKSSLLRVVAGLDRPDSGRVVVDGVDIQRLTGRRLRGVRRDLIGYVFQRPEENFIPYLTIRKNLDVVARAAPHRADREVLDALGMADRGGHEPAGLSGGEQQRAALAQVLLIRPPFVVADEPTAELDAHSSHLLLSAISEAARDGVGFIIATHDPDVAAIADTVVQIDSGVVSSGNHDRVNAQRAETRVDEVGTARHRQRVLSTENVSKSYMTRSETIAALDDVSLDLHQGELVALLGRSGSGKTTLLNVLAGWERPDSGTVVGVLSSVDRPRWAELSVVPQTLGLIEELTVAENVRLPLLLSSGSEATTVGTLLQSLGLQQLANRYPKEISLGEQQRCAIARAVIAGPAVVLADEPTAHQDVGSAQLIFNALRERVAAGACVVAATHDVRLLDHADRVVHMEDGRLI